MQPRRRQMRRWAQMDLHRNGVRIDGIDADAMMQAAGVKRSTSLHIHMELLLRIIESSSKATCDGIYNVCSSCRFLCF